MNWNTINIATGQAIIKANDLEPWERDIQILIALHGKDVDYYESLPDWMLVQKIKKTAWVNEVPQVRVMARPFRSGNYLYKFKTHASQLSHGDFALLQSYAKDHVGNLHLILALLSSKFRIFPHKEIFMDSKSDKDLQERGELFRTKMKFGLAYAYCLFFSTYYPTLLKVGLSYLMGVKEAAQRQTL